ncbi:MAG: hypothetical protein ABIU87_05015 [Ornithinibacter sp.]
MTVTFRKITAANLESVLSLRATPEQERFVSSIANSMVGPLDAPGMPEAARQQRLPGPTARFASDDEPMRLVEPKYSLKRARSWDTEKDPDGLIARTRAAVSTTLEDETTATVENEATRQIGWVIPVKDWAFISAVTARGLTTTGVHPIRIAPPRATL